MGPPPIKQPWGLLIRGQHYLRIRPSKKQIIHEFQVFSFLAPKNTQPDDGKAVASPQAINTLIIHM